MTTSLNLVSQFQEAGYFCPLTVFSAEHARRLRTEFEAIEAKTKGDVELSAALKNSANWVLPWFDSLARSPAIVEPVASILGPDLLALHVDVFIKEADTPNYISWHQDLHYWGLDSDEEITAWLALSPSNAESGCMRFLPRSHKQHVEHRDTFSTNNMLTRGQEVAVASTRVPQYSPN